MRRTFTQALLHTHGWRPDWPAVLHVALRLTRGLHAVHNAGIVHRDVKPGNVLMDDTGGVVLSDFGIAEHASTLHGSSLAAAPSGGFQKARIMGTLQYLAPEVLLNQFHVQVRPLSSGSLGRECTAAYCA